MSGTREMVSVGDRNEVSIGSEVEKLAPFHPGEACQADRVGVRPKPT